MRRLPSRLAGSLALALATLLGCATEEPASEPPPADQTYAADGVVVQLPGGPAGELVVRHQPIPDFVSRQGELVGMDSMAMPFAIAPGVDLAGIATGDPVRFHFEVRWEGDPILRIARLEKLPAGTTVDFEAPGTLLPSAPPAATAAAGPAPEKGPASDDGAE